MHMSQDVAFMSTRRIRSWRRHAPVFLLFLLLAMVMTYPLALRLSDAVVNYGDPLLNTWIMAWDIHALKTQPLHLFDANNFYPYENTLAYSENLLTTALLAAPWTWLTDNPVLAHNMLTLLSFALGGFCAYLLIEYLTGRSFGGMIGGIVFAFAHYRFGQISHLQLLTSWWIPLAIYFLERFFSQRRNRDLACFAACFIAQAWATIYLGIFLASAVALHVLYRWLTSTDLLKDRSLWIRLGAAGLVIAVSIAVLYIPYSQASEVVGTRELEGQNGAALRDYLSAHPNSLAARFRALSPVQESPEHTLFPGFVCLALSLWGILKERNHRRKMAFYVVLGLISLILSLGPHLHVTRDQPPLLEGLPYAVVYRYIPFIRAIRVPARLALLVMLSLAVFAGFGAATVADTARRRRWIWYGVVAIGLMLDYAAIPLSLVPIEVGDQVPSVYRWLRRQTPNSVIFEFPTAASPDITGDDVSIPRLSRHQYFSVYHWQPLTMGYSGFYPPLFWQSLDYGLQFPSHDSLAYLRGLGVRYVLIHEDELSNEELLHTQLSLRRQADLLSKVGRYGETEVYRLPTDPPVEADVELYLPSAARPDRSYYAYVLVRLPPDRARVSQHRSSYQLTFEWQPQDGEVISGEVHGQLPMVVDSGTTVLPLSLSGPSQWPATLKAQFQGLSKTVEMTQTVGAQEDIVTELEAMADDFDYVGAPLGDDLTLTHVHLPRGRDHVAGDPLSVMLYWRRRISTERELTTYVHILNQEGLKVAQVDTPLSFTNVFDRHVIPLPWDLPPGSYDVVVGVYAGEGHQAVGEPLELGRIHVQQPAALEEMVRGPSSFKLGENVELLGYHLDPSAAQPGHEVTLTLYWRCRRRMGRDYKVFTHLLSQDGEILDQQDAQPRSGHHPTSSWQPGEVIVDRYRLTVPPDAQPGPYPLAMGMYFPDNGQRLPVRREGGTSLPEGRIVLTELQVTPDDG